MYAPERILLERRLEHGVEMHRFSNRRSFQFGGDQDVDSADGPFPWLQRPSCSGRNAIIPFWQKIKLRAINRFILEKKPIRYVNTKACVMR